MIFSRALPQNASAELWCRVSLVWLARSTSARSRSLRVVGVSRVSGSYGCFAVLGISVSDNGDVLSIVYDPTLYETVSLNNGVSGGSSADCRRWTTAPDASLIEGPQGGTKPLLSARVNCASKDSRRRHLVDSS